jgi:hypothetical protein
MSTITTTNSSDERSSPSLEVPGFFNITGSSPPGIRLFRSIGFPAKAAWVSIAVLAPVTILLVSLVSNAMSDIEFSVKERQSLEIERTIYPLLRPRRSGGRPLFSAPTYSAQVTTSPKPSILCPTNNSSSVKHFIRRLHGRASRPHLRHSRPIL